MNPLEHSVRLEAFSGLSCSDRKLSRFPTFFARIISSTARSRLPSTFILMSVCFEKTIKFEGLPFFFRVRDWVKQVIDSFRACKVVTELRQLQFVAVGTNVCNFY